MEPPSSTVKTCLSVLQKTPPKKSGLALEVLKEALASSRSDALNELMKRVIGFPMPIQVDASKGKKFLLCEFNKQSQDGYRSPFDQEQNLSDELRLFEVHANEVWEAYTNLYYGKEAVGSVYVKDAGDTGVLIACFLVKKTVEGDERLAEGEWNSAHMVHVGNVSNGSSKYKISSTVTICMDPTCESSLSANVSRDTEQVYRVKDLASHLENVGKMIESIEIDVRSSLENVVIPKTREVVSVLRRDGRGTPVGGGGIPIMMSRPRKRSGPPAGAIAMPGMGGAHAAALNAAVLKRAPKK